MAEILAVENKILERYSQLSEKLKLAADFIVSNPLDVASRSLRSIASSAGLSPATFTRLAKAIGYNSYEELREESRKSFSEKLESFTERAARIRSESQQGPINTLLNQQGQACRANIDTLFSGLDEKRLERSAKSLLNAKRVYLVGALGSASMLDYLAYMAGWFLQNWYVSGRNGVTLSSILANLEKGDVVVVLSLAPFAKRSVAAAKIARERKAKVIVVTDSHTFPELSSADEHFLVRTESANFFSSYASVLVLFETMVSLMVSLSGEKADASISKIEKENQRLEEI